MGARSPTTDLLLDAIERLADYLYWLRPGNRERADKDATGTHAERLRAALAAFEAAGLGGGPMRVQGWTEIVPACARTIVNSLWQHRTARADPDQWTCLALEDQIRIVRDEVFFAMGRDFDEAKPVVVTEAGLARLIDLPESSRSRLFKRLSDQGRIRVEPTEDRPQSRYRRVWFLFPGEHTKFFAKWNRDGENR